MVSQPSSAENDNSPVLVVIVNDPADLERARDTGWYRIPTAHAPQRIAADYLALYQTAAFPPDERWQVRWLAAIRGYRIVTRRELIPQEQDHPRAAESYYRIDLGPVLPLSHPIPSRRLRRITFINTTLDKLLAAEEINDLWIKTPAQQRLWEALKAAEMDAEVNYPLGDDFSPTADLALSGVAAHEERLAIFVSGDAEATSTVAETADLDYYLAAGNWRAVHIASEDVMRDAAACAAWLAEVSRSRTPYATYTKG